MQQDANYQFAIKTKSTAIFPNTANSTTIQTDARNQCDPMTSSHGFSASGSGKQCTSIFLLNRDEISKIECHSCDQQSMCAKHIYIFPSKQIIYLVVNFPHIACSTLFGLISESINSPKSFVLMVMLSVSALLPFEWLIDEPVIRLPLVRDAFLVLNFSSIWPSPWMLFKHRKFMN